MADFSRVIELNPRFGNAYVYRGLIHYHKGDLDRAIWEYNRALEINPKDDVAYADRGLAYYYKRDYDRALADLNRAIEYNPKYTNAYNSRGLAYYKKGDLERALADYGRALKLDPQYAKAYYNRGLALVQKGELDRGLAEYNRALELNPRYAKVFYSKAALLERMGRSDEALEAYQSFLKYGHPRDNAHIQEAQERIDALRRSPKRTQTAARRGPGPLPKEDGDQTLAEVNRGLERDPADAEARFQKAELLDKAGKKSEALEAYKTFLRYCPPQARVQMIQATERIRALER
jgi:tetratricopeptide (TPR) repeat protein